MDPKQAVILVQQPFALPTRTAGIRLLGQIDLPASHAGARLPCVIIVPGGWFMDRDGYMGGTGTDRDLVYRDFGAALNEAACAVIRFDQRGVRCNERTMPPAPASATEFEITEHYLKHCVEPGARRTVTFRTLMDDIKAVYDFTAAHPQVDPRRIVLWAHSEGALHSARLIGHGLINPAGLILVGAISESPAAIFRWQSIDRYVERLMSWDDDQDGVVHEANVRKNYPADDLFTAAGLSLDSLLPPASYWTVDSARAHFLADYERMKAETLARPADAEFPVAAGENSCVVASNGWWMQWFIDEVPVIDSLVRYPGVAVFHTGGIDAHVGGRRQTDYGERRCSERPFLRPPRFTLHPGRGHAFRTGHPSIGPMDEGARTVFVEEVRTILNEKS